MSSHKKKYQLFIILLIVFSAFIEPASAQDIRWRRGSVVVPELALFHSTHAINLPTAETLQTGDFEFEVSHHFIPFIKEGSAALWGLDGPVNIRLALGYAPSDNMIITLGRSNVTDNLDLQVKYKLAQVRNDIVPFGVTLNVGIARNANVGSLSNGCSRNFQYFGQIIFNTMIIDKIGFGLVPAYLYNSALTTNAIKYSFTMGTYLQYYIVRSWSVLMEWNPTVTGWRASYNSLSMGVELETGGHFFKIFVTNNSFLNTSQFLAGAINRFSNGDIRLGFMITRLL